MSADNKPVNKNEKATGISPGLYNTTMRVFKTGGNNEVLISLELRDILREIKGVSFDIDQYGNFLITKGEADFYPCFMAHTDTVHQYDNGFNLIVCDGILYAYDDHKKQVGCGGDDRAGVVAIIELLRTLDTVKACLFTGEESGGTGSGGVDMGFFNDCSFIASIDRWNNCDFVSSYGSYKTINNNLKQRVEPLLNKYGYSHASGMFTDCFNLVDRGIGLSAMNISCGYYQHHSHLECVILSELQNCVDFCAELATIADEPYYHIVSMYESYNDSFRENGSFKNRLFDDEPLEDSDKVCENCHLYSGKLTMWDRLYLVCDECYAYLEEYYKEEYY